MASEGHSASNASVLPVWVLGFAVIFQFMLLPILWQSSRGQGSLVWTATSAGLMLLAAIVCRADRLDCRALSILVASFLTLYLLFGFLNYQLVGRQSQERYDWLMESSKVMPLAAIYYAFGVVVGGRQPVRALAIAIIGGALYTFATIDSYSTQALWERTQQGLNVTYQYAGDAFAIAALLLLGWTGGAGLRFGLMILAVVVLFIIPSRSSAMVGVLSMMSWAFFYTRQRAFVLLGLTVCALVAWQLGWLEPEALESTFSGTRFETLVKGEVDSSKEARDQIAVVGLDVIRKHFFTGYVGFQVDILGSSGYYIHSALDIWAQSGLVPFGLFVGLWLWIAFRVLTPYSPIARHREKFTGVLLFSLLSWIFARHTHVGILYFPLGVASACLAGNGGSRIRRLRPASSFAPGGNDPARSMDAGTSR